MKTLSTILLVLSSSDFRIAAGSGVRGAGGESEDGTPQQLVDRDLPKNDGEGDADGGRGSRLFRGPPVRKPPDEENEEDPPAPIKDDDSLADTKAVAKMMNLSIRDAEELLKQQREFAALVDDLQNDDNFLQAEMPSEPNGQFVLRYKNGDMPSKSQKGVDKFMAKNKKAKVKSEPAKFSLKEAQGRGSRLADQLEGKGYSHVSFSIDGDGIEFIAKKLHGQKKRKGTGKVAAARVAEILDLKQDDGGLDELALFLLEDEDEDPARPHHTYGGRKIYNDGSEWPGCTTAFTVKNLAGASASSGVLTAGHCQGMNRYDAVPAESDYATYRRGEHRGLLGDFEWHTTSHVEPAEYYAKPTTRWPVRSVASSISKGEWVCGYSRMRGVRRCSKVMKTSVSVNYPNHPRMYNLVAMEGNFMFPGDSGGPWSWYDKAYGVHSGSTTICDFWIFGCKNHDVWSRAGFLPWALGVTVKTEY